MSGEEFEGDETAGEEYVVEVGVARVGGAVRAHADLEEGDVPCDVVQLQLSFLPRGQLQGVQLVRTILLAHCKFPCAVLLKGTILNIQDS